MIEKSNEIFDAVAKDLRSAYKKIRVVGEYVATPTEFPCVTLDEIRNTPVHRDTAVQNKYAEVTYRVQVFSNKNGSKRSQAREIYGRVDEKLQEMGFGCVTFTTTPEIYNSDIYSITATYRGVIDRNGVVYRA